MNIQEEILNSIQVMVDKSIENSQHTQTVASVVEGYNSEGYIVTVNGNKCTIYDSVGCNPSIGDGVWVQVPNGDVKKAFITGLRGNAVGGGGGVSKRNQADWQELNSTSASYIRNKYITVNTTSNRNLLENKDSFGAAFGKINKWFSDLNKYAFASKLIAEDITDLDDVLSKPIPDDMIHSLFN